MGPTLQTFELEAWARSRSLSKADTEQLRGVFEERDTFHQALGAMVDRFTVHTDDDDVAILAALRVLAERVAGR